MNDLKISVIVPTLWLFPDFVNVCVDVADHDLVQEVIVINNCEAQQPDREHEIWHHDKIKILNLGCNLYVNPSWNLGAYHAQADILCLWNDDLIFDLHLFEIICAQFKPEHGVCGLGVGPPQACCHLQLHTQEGLWGFGQLMFVYKSQWLDIPADLRVYCGDNWIFDTQKSKWGNNLFIKGVLYYTPGYVGGTSSRQFVQVVWRERELYLQVIDKYQIPYQIGFGE